MEENQPSKYEVLRRLAVAGARGDQLQTICEMALRQAADLVGLSAASLYLWDEDGQVNLAVTHADSDTSRGRLASLEEDLFTGLRKERRLLSAYMSFEGTPPLHSFTLPLRYHDRVFGAVIGIQEGERTIVSEDIFLEALSAAVALNIVAENAGKDQAISRDVLDKERLGAIVETAVTVNHEINNPLTAILGNVQLLLLKRSDMDEELRGKLQTIEEAAMKIRDVTQRLLKMKSVRSVEYTDGTSMIDLSRDDEESAP